MCLPPIDSNSQEYFKLLNQNCGKINLKELSMGMSSDFEEAILNRFYIFKNWNFNFRKKKYYLIEIFVSY